MFCVDGEGFRPFEEDKPLALTYPTRQEENKVVSRAFVGVKKSHSKHRLRDPVFLSIR
jgi:hypothetical protein